MLRAAVAFIRLQTHHQKPIFVHILVPKFQTTILKPPYEGPDILQAK